VVDLPALPPDLSVAPVDVADAAGGAGGRRGNVTGALGVYQRLGFRTTRTQVSWSTALSAGADG
jgi:hypothetical protein